MSRASDVMRAPPPTVAPADSLARAAEIMADFSMRELAVVEDGAIVGILARSDLDPHVGQLEWTPVRVAMSMSPRTVSPDAAIGEVARALLDGNFNAIPVVLDGTLTGMITRHDLLRLLVDL
jgi:CBS domain-containing protein